MQQAGREREQPLARGSRSLRLRAVVGILAALFAVIAVLVGARAVVRDPLGPGSVHAGRTVPGAVAEAPASPGAPASVDASQPIQAMPSGFVVWSLSPVFGRTQFALGSATCEGTSCPVLLRTSDGGRTWQSVHRFAQADVSSAQGAAQPAIQPAGALSQVRFLDANNGVVFGSDLWVTHDGGRSFTQVRHPGVSILDVAYRGTQALVLSASGCIQGSCSGRLELARVSSGPSPDLASTLAAVTTAGAVADADLVATSGAVIVHTEAERETGGASSSWRLSGGAFTPVTTGAACNSKPLDALTPTVAGRVFALCDAVVTPTSISYSSVVSSDGGATWQQVGVGNVTLPTQGRVSIAASGGDALVAVSGGPREAVDGTTRSSANTAIAWSGDGGRRWAAASLDPGQPVGGFDSIQSSSGSFTSLTRIDGDVWRSNDGGRHWTRHGIGSR